VLVFSHIAHARNGGRDLPLGEFVRQFAGLTSTKKAKAVCAHLPGFAYLSDFEENPDAVGELLVPILTWSPEWEPIPCARWKTHSSRSASTVVKLSSKRSERCACHSVPYYVSLQKWGLWSGPDETRTRDLRHARAV